MTPKEKAEELYRYYIDYTYGSFNCKQCVILSIEEIIKSQPSFPMAWHLGIEINGLVDNAMYPLKYWEEVKKEIENL